MTTKFIFLLLTLVLGAASCKKLIFEPSSKIHEVEENVRTECPDKHECGSGDTCCEILTGKFGCCELPEAVCCADRLHCCPKGTTCDVTHAKCINSYGLRSNWHRHSYKVEAEVINDAIKCPDNASYCPEGQTCCQFASGAYGCCPMQSAVCCEDKEHCCPHGSTCEAATSSCKFADEGASIPWQKKEAAEIRAGAAENVVTCPDRVSYCYEGQTCCINWAGRYNCCPYPLAQCCFDRLHCCPFGMMCDATSRLCLRGDSSVASPSAAKVPSRALSLDFRKVKCDEDFSCQVHQTCCLEKSGKYGCCPFPNAVCCDDKEHCCPSGFQCESAGYCRKNFQLTALGASAPSTEEPKSSKVVCPDKKSYCQDGQTCCLMKGGQYGCCPYTKGVCCSDREHCCPSGYVCDSSQICRKDSSLLLLGASTTDVIKKDVLCPKKTKFCPENYTCCNLPSGQESCCPYPKAQCCPDEYHCCPEGFVCSGGQCKPKPKEAPMMRAEKSLIVVCDNATFCADNQTCCKGQDGDFKCCPVSGASCCKDGIHCCRSWCMPYWNKCLPNNVKRPSESDDATLESVQAQKLVWCDQERKLYCPVGFSCDVARLVCVEEARLEQLTASNGLEAIRSSHVCPSDIGEQTRLKCREGETCCLVGNNQVKCCPFKDGVCCKGGSHCCPSGSTCKNDVGMCENRNQEFWVGTSEMEPPDEMESPPTNATVHDVECKDKSTCPDKTTCCPQVDGHFTCCQFKNAVCCKDFLHCCPHGYTCDLVAQSCTIHESRLPWGFHAGTRAEGAETEVRCGGEDGFTHFCPPGHSCCYGKDEDGNEGPSCCPNDGSICCGGFCCPANHQCGREKDTCVKINDQP